MPRLPDKSEKARDAFEWASPKSLGDASTNLSLFSLFYFNHAETPHEPRAFLISNDPPYVLST